MAFSFLYVAFGALLGGSAETCVFIGRLWSRVARRRWRRRGLRIGGGVWGDPDPDHVSDVTFHVQVPDVEAALAKAERLGGTRVFGPDMVPGTEIELG